MGGINLPKSKPLYVRCPSSLFHVLCLQPFSVALHFIEPKSKTLNCHFNSSLMPMEGWRKSSSKFVATEEADDDSGGGAEFKFGEVAPAAALSLLCLHQSTRPPLSSSSSSQTSSSSSSSQIKSSILTITACTGDCKDGGFSFDFQASRSPKLTSDIVHAITMSNHVQSWHIMAWW